MAKARIQFTIDQDVADDLENFAEWRHISKSAVVTLALQEYFEAHADWQEIFEKAAYPRLMGMGKEQQQGNNTNGITGEIQ